MVERDDTFNPLRSAIHAPCPRCEFEHALPAGLLNWWNYRCMRCGQLHNGTTERFK